MGRVGLSGPAFFHLHFLEGLDFEGNLSSGEVGLFSWNREKQSPEKRNHPESCSVPFWLGRDSRVRQGTLTLPHPLRRSTSDRLIASKYFRTLYPGREGQTRPYLPSQAAGKGWHQGVRKGTWSNVHAAPSFPLPRYYRILSAWACRPVPLRDESTHCGQEARPEIVKIAISWTFHLRILLGKLQGLEVSGGSGDLSGKNPVPTCCLDADRRR